jgi:purine-binding chemotaxis protein CheW
VVVEVGNEYVGLIVDRVSEVMRIPYAVIEPPASIVKGSAADYVLGIAKLETKLVILLDTDRLLSTDEEQTVLALNDTELEVSGAAR